MDRKRVSDDTPLAEKVARKRAGNSDVKKGYITKVWTHKIEKEIFEDIRWSDKREFLRTGYCGGVIVEVSGIEEFYISFDVDPMVGENEFISYLYTRTSFPSKKLDTVLYGLEITFDVEEDYVLIENEKISAGFNHIEFDEFENTANLQEVTKWIEWINMKDYVTETTMRQVEAVYEKEDILILEVETINETVEFHIPYGDEMFWKVTNDIGGGLLQNIEGSFVHIVLRDIHDYLSRKNTDLDGWVSEDNVWTMMTSEVKSPQEVPDSYESEKSLIGRLLN